MTDDVIQHPGGTIIINGGNALGDCPKDWDQAKILEQYLNANRQTDDLEWKFDCGFKLDFDGGLLTISSRFYPPKTHGGVTWDGDVSIYFSGNEIHRKAFDCETLEQLKESVDAHVDGIKNKIGELLKEIEL